MEFYITCLTPPRLCTCCRSRTDSNRFYIFYAVNEFEKKKKKLSNEQYFRYISNVKITFEDEWMPGCAHVGKRGENEHAPTIVQCNSQSMTTPDFLLSFVL